jgi:hypothetical protein
MNVGCSTAAVDRMLFRRFIINQNRSGLLPARQCVIENAGAVAIATALRWLSQLRSQRFALVVIRQSCSI